MADGDSPEIFISYARSAQPQASAIAAALRASGYSVWWDADLPAHRAYNDVIEERLNSAKAVLVVWSRDGASSEWVRAEADAARHGRKLVQLSIDGVIPPMPFNQIQCPALRDWDGTTDEPAWRKVERSIAELVHGTGSELARPAAAAPSAIPSTSICVLPFVNMSADAEQEYFSDGITEDLITDLSKISSLGVIARNTSFTFKGQSVEARSLGHELAVSHILEGSVRKSGNRLRISAQLIDAATGQHLWAERYDRELADIFDIQDELSRAIVAALKLKLLPEEKKAIERRGTDNAEAYNLYLMARQYWVAGNDGDWKREELIIRICERAIGIDPGYAHGWALMAIAQTHLRFRQGKREANGLEAAERALSLDPDLAEAHAVKAWHLLEQGQQEDAGREIAAALRLDPESWEVNKVAGKVLFIQGRLREAAACYEKAAALMDMDYHAAGMVESCYKGMGDGDGRSRAARVTLARVEKALESNPRDASAIANGAISLAIIGETERSREWAERALVLEPENYILRYNIACTFVQLGDHDRALDLVGDSLSHLGKDHIRHTQADPDIAVIRDNPRFARMIADAKGRLQVD
ncbi:MAG TPA: TIR domain-containing protein, partial [Vicinamibacterales bacterium]|nr:TIR domain-containing protein [Vicinamibacterales bacterium]